MPLLERSAPARRPEEQDDSQELSFDEAESSLHSKEDLATRKKDLERALAAYMHDYQYDAETGNPHGFGSGRFIKEHFLAGDEKGEDHLKQYLFTLHSIERIHADLAKTLEQMDSLAAADGAPALGVSKRTRERAAHMQEALQHQQLAEKFSKQAAEIQTMLDVMDTGKRLKHADQARARFQKELRKMTGEPEPKKPVLGRMKPPEPLRKPTKNEPEKITAENIQPLEEDLEELPVQEPPVENIPPAEPELEELPAENIQPPQEERSIEDIFGPRKKAHTFEAPELSVSENHRAEAQKVREEIEDMTLTPYERGVKALKKIEAELQPDLTAGRIRINPDTEEIEFIKRGLIKNTKLEALVDKYNEQVLKNLRMHEGVRTNAGVESPLYKLKQITDAMEAIRTEPDGLKNYIDAGVVRMNPDTDEVEYTSGKFMRFMKGALGFKDRHLEQLVERYNKLQTEKRVIEPDAMQKAAGDSSPEGRRRTEVRQKRGAPIDRTLTSERKPAPQKTEEQFWKEGETENAERPEPTPELSRFPHVAEVNFDADYEVSQLAQEDKASRKKPRIFVLGTQFFAGATDDETRTAAEQQFKKLLSEQVGAAAAEQSYFIRADEMSREDLLRTIQYYEDRLSGKKLRKESVTSAAEDAEKYRSKTEISVTSPNVDSLLEDLHQRYDSKPMRDIVLLNVSDSFFGSSDRIRLSERIKTMKLDLFKKRLTEEFGQRFADNVVILRTTKAEKE